MHSCANGNSRTKTKTKKHVTIAPGGKSVRKRAGHEKRVGWLRFQREWRHGITPSSLASVTERGPAKESNWEHRSSNSERTSSSLWKSTHAAASSGFGWGALGFGAKPRFFIWGPGSIVRQSEETQTTPLSPIPTPATSRLLAKKGDFPWLSLGQLTWPWRPAHILRLYVSWEILTFVKNADSWN